MDLSISDASRDTGTGNSYYDMRDRGNAASVAAVRPLHLFLARCALLLFCLGIAGRVLLGDAVLNSYYHYTTVGGNLAGKIHPSNYLFLLASLLLYLGPGFRFRQADLPILRAVLVFGAVVVAVNVPPMLRGHTGSIGYIADTYLFAMLACVLALAFPPGWRIRGAMIGIAAIVFNSLIAIGEFAAGRYVVPFDVQPAEFRPAGLFGAALNVGVINLTAMLFLFSSNLHFLVRLIGAALLCAGIFVSASRTSMLVMALFAPLIIAISARVRGQGMSAGVTTIVMLLAAIILVPVVIAIAAELGLFKRFSEGIVDDSAKTRIEIFKVFGFVGWSDIVLGGNVEEIRRLAFLRLGILHIENPLVTFIFNFGLPMTIVFLFALAWLLLRISQHAHPAIGLTLIAFIGVALTNNTLSTKVPSFFLAVILALGFRAYHARFTLR